MTIQIILNDKNIKPNEKTELISKMLLNGEIETNELITFAKSSKDPIKATCIESFEFATKSNPKFATLDCLDFAILSLKEKAPRIKWESAKVIGNIASLFPDRLEQANENLLVNVNHIGTVVRWSSAYAIGEIIKIKSETTKELIPKIKEICEKEEKNSIKKIYLAALKKVGY